MSDAIDRLQDMRDRIDALMQGEEKRAAKLEEARLVLANALAALEVASPYLRHEGPRAQVLGVKKQIKGALAA